MGDFNQWGASTGAMRELAQGWQSLVPGRSFPAHNPVAQLDRIIACNRWRVVAHGVHHSAQAAKASDHLPVWARLELPIK
jgi:endonuclease/exonuclease/phosphatase family metal-dependent hydrolase